MSKKIIKHDFTPIRQFRCTAKGCKAKTENWYKDGWLITGSGQSEFTDVASSKTEEVERGGKLVSETTRLNDRGILEDAELIVRTNLSTALICPDHTPMMRTHLESFRKTGARKEYENQNQPEPVADLWV